MSSINLSIGIFFVIIFIIWVVPYLIKKIGTFSHNKISEKPLGEKLKPQPDKETIYFKDNQSAFEYACKYSDTEIKIDKPLVAIVCSHFDKIKENNLYIVKISSDDGGFFATGIVLNKYEVEKDDLIIWIPQKDNNHPPFLNNKDDPRSGWVGLISATLKPKLALHNGWEIKNEYLD